MICLEKKKDDWKRKKKNTNVEGSVSNFRWRGTYGLSQDITVPVYLKIKHGLSSSNLLLPLHCWSSLHLISVNSLWCTTSMNLSYKIG